MAKAVLVLDETPKNCLDCELADCRYIPNVQNSKMPYGIYCTAKEWKIADSWLDLNVNDKRQDWCPLKELPEHITYEDLEEYPMLDPAYVYGYNLAIDDVEGTDYCGIKSLFQHQEDN